MKSIRKDSSYRADEENALFSSLCIVYKTCAQTNCETCRLRNHCKVYFGNGGIEEFVHDALVERGYRRPGPRVDKLATTVDVGNMIDISNVIECLCKACVCDGCTRESFCEDKMCPRKLRYIIEDYAAALCLYPPSAEERL